MKKILIVQPIHEKGMELLKSNSNYTYEVVEDLSVENVKQKIIDADAVSLRTSILPAEAIENAKKLKIISRHGVGYDNIDLDSCKKKKYRCSDNCNSKCCSGCRTCSFHAFKYIKKKKYVRSISQKWKIY